jgi:hypothetical protein
MLNYLKTTAVPWILPKQRFRRTVLRGFTSTDDTKAICRSGCIHRKMRTFSDRASPKIIYRLRNSTGPSLVRSAVLTYSNLRTKKGGKVAFADRKQQSGWSDPPPLQHHRSRPWIPIQFFNVFANARPDRVEMNVSDQRTDIILILR